MQWRLVTVRQGGRDGRSHWFSRANKWNHAFFWQIFVHFRANARKLLQINENNIAARTLTSDHEPPLTFVNFCANARKRTQISEKKTVVYTRRASNAKKTAFSSGGLWTVVRLCPATDVSYADFRAFARKWMLTSIFSHIFVTVRANARNLNTKTSEKIKRRRAVTSRHSFQIHFRYFLYNFNHIYFCQYTLHKVPTFTFLELQMMTEYRVSFFKIFIIGRTSTN